MKTPFTVSEPSLPDVLPSMLHTELVTLPRTVRRADGIGGDRGVHIWTVNESMRPLMRMPPWMRLDLGGRDAADAITADGRDVDVAITRGPGQHLDQQLTVGGGAVEHDTGYGALARRGRRRGWSLSRCPVREAERGSCHCHSQRAAQAARRGR